MFSSKRQKALFLFFGANTNTSVLTILNWCSGALRHLICIASASLTIVTSAWGQWLTRISTTGTEPGSEMDDYFYFYFVYYVYTFTCWHQYKTETHISFFIIHTKDIVWKTLPYIFDLLVLKFHLVRYWVLDHIDPISFSTLL